MATNLEKLRGQLGSIYTEQDPLELALMPKSEPAPMAAPMAPSAPKPEAPGMSDDTTAMLITTLGPALLGAFGGDTGARAAQKTSDAVVPMWSANQKLRAEEKKEARKLALEQEREIRRESRQDENAARSEDRFNRQLQASDDRLDKTLAAQNARALAKPEGGKQLSAGDVLKVNEGNSIPTMLLDVEETIKQNEGLFSPGKGQLRSLNPWDEQAQTVDGQLRTASQAFGKFMEGGVLRKEDEEKYRKMFPKPGDTPQVAANKLALVQRQLITKQQSDIQALKASGYDVSGLSGNPAIKEGKEVPGVLRKNQAQKTVLKREFSPSRNQTRVTYSDGSTETLEGKQ